jgi:hypothetical protein
LADDVRVQAPLFVEAAVSAFREKMELEVARLRGYAYESQSHDIRLNVSVEFCFRPEHLGVTVATVPQFIPTPFVSRKRIKMPSKRRDPQLFP